MEERAGGLCEREAPAVTVETLARGGGGKIRFNAPGYWTYTALVWLGGTAAAGIVGSAAYDAFKRLMRRLRAAKRLQLSREEAFFVAGLVLVVRCRSLSLEPPNLNALTCQAGATSAGGWHVVLASEQLTAVVEIPSGDPAEMRSAVTILRHRSIEQAESFFKSSPW